MIILNLTLKNKTVKTIVWACKGVLLLIAHDIEIIKDNKKYKVSNNTFTGSVLEVVSYDVKGSGYDREYSTVNGAQGRFFNSVYEEKKTVSLRLRYQVDKMAQVTHLKSNLQALLRGHYYLRELSTPDTSIKYEDIFNTKPQEFELDYVDGRQIFVGLVNAISIDTTQTAGEFELEFETIELPYFESIAYSTDLESESRSVEKWAVSDNLPFNVNDNKRNYTFHDTKICNVYYAGTVEINQINQDSTVEVTLAENVSKNDKNGTTFYMVESGDVINIKGLELKAGDTIKFDGIHTFRNGLNIDAYNVSRRNPTLIPGWNTFRSTKLMQKVVFKHKEYYM